MKSRLLWKILGSHLLVIVVVIVLVCGVIEFLAAKYYTTLMHDYDISPKVVHGMFLEALHKYVDGTGLLACVLAVLLSFFLTRRVLRPLEHMTGMAKQIAGGNYSQRIQPNSKDEVGHLAASFNQMAENLQHLEQLRKSMVSDLSHELRTPLTNLRGHVEALSDGVVVPSKPVFDSLLEEILRLVKLVEDVSHLARAEAARFTLKRQEIDVPSFFTRALDLFNSRFDERRIVVQAVFPPTTHRIVADPNRLSQAVGNLLDNAVHYTEDGGHFRILAERLSDSVKFSFSNTGGGLRADDVRFLFERFYRGDKSRRRDHAGVGLGLSIVKELVEAHGGQVGAESSEAETTIWFTLPT